MAELATPRPGQYPPSMLQAAEQLPYLAGRLAGRLPKTTLDQVGSLLQITNAYYTTVLDGLETKPAELARSLRSKRTQQLTSQAAGHIYTQQACQRLIDIFGPRLAWEDMVSPAWTARVHGRLFMRRRASAFAVPQHPAAEELAQGQPPSGERLPDLGGQLDQTSEVRTRLLMQMGTVYGAPEDQRSRIISAMAYHHRLACSDPFEGGGGQLARLLTHLQLHYLGLSASLWSLQRGLAGRQDTYEHYLGDVGRSEPYGFIEFMLDTCLEQMKFMDTLLNPKHLRDKLSNAFINSPEIQRAAIKPGCAKAIHILFSHGEVSRSDFKVFTGLGEKLATEQVAKLVALGLVVAPTPKSRQLYPGIPLWFAEMLFPELHQRFKPA